MSESSPIIRQCPNPDCSFRFPAPAVGSAGRFCPRCGWETQIVLTPRPTGHARNILSNPKGPIVEALLDNIRSTYNVGSIFRASDGAGLQHLHLCGITPTPQNIKVAKTALGSEETVTWTYHANAVTAAENLKQQGFRLCALEVTQGAQSIFEIAPLLDDCPLLLMVGNEVNGVDPDLLKLSDHVVWIPMQGKKESLNVSLAFGIAAYILRFNNKQNPE
jgi:23S rRNA (guanosine2251-2'-O)-methyltransferase